MKYAVVLSLKYSKDWLVMSRDERNRFNERNVVPILTRYHGKVGARFFDAEAFSAEASDFVLFEFNDPKNYYFLMEELRDSELFTKELLTIKGILMGIEDGYQVFEREAAK